MQIDLIDGCFTVDSMLVMYSDESVGSKFSSTDDLFVVVSMFSDGSMIGSKSSSIGDDLLVVGSMFSDASMIGSKVSSID